MWVEPIEVISNQGQLDQVEALGRKNAKTLGFLPDGAFEDAFRRKTILVAPETGGICRGYLLYRVTRRIAHITHLCIEDGWRKQGLAKSLVLKLVELTRDLEGISLLCRADYDATSFWPKVGFAFLGERPGRGHARRPLKAWWRDQKDT